MWVDLRDGQDQVHSSRLTDGDSGAQRSDLPDASQLESVLARNTKSPGTSNLVREPGGGVPVTDLRQGYRVTWKLLSPKFRNF